MATVGVVIALATVAEEVIEVGVARWPVAAILHAAAKRAAVASFAATQGLTIQAVRVPAQVVRQLRVAAADVPAAAAECAAAAAVECVAAAAECAAAAAVVDMPAAGTGNL
jgi:hypothetical protein